MSYVSPELRPKFETLSIELKDMILERNVELNTIHDLIRVWRKLLQSQRADPRLCNAVSNGYYFASFRPYL